MAQFTGTIKGFSPNKISRRGSKNSGLIAEINGWNLGIKIVAKHDKKTYQDIFMVYKTKGSNGYNTPELFDAELLTVIETEPVIEVKNKKTKNTNTVLELA